MPLPGQLNPQLRKRLTQANATGNQAAFLGRNPNVQQRISALQGGNARQRDRATTLLSAGMAGPGIPSQPDPTTSFKPSWPAPPGSPGSAPPGQRPTGQPGVGAGGGKAPPAATTPARPAAPAAPPPTFGQAFNQAYGQGAENQFGQLGWYGENPLKTAQAAGERALGENLAQIRNRYAQSGGGSSGREALAEGQATGDFATKFGDIAAERGLAARQSDLGRLAEMFSGAGAQDLQAQQLGLSANEQLMRAGTGVTGIGTSEQSIPNADLLTTLITNLSRQNNFSEGRQRQPSK